MRFIIATVGICAFFSLACTRPAVDARQLLNESRIALRGVESVEYRFTFESSGEGSTAPMQGRVVLQRLDLSGSRYLAYLDAKVGPGNDSSHRLVGVKQAERIQLLDGDRRILHTGSPYSGGGILVGRMSPAFMYPFFDPESLAGEIEALEVTLESTDRNGEIDCDWVRVRYDNDDEDSRWCIGRLDRLPRALEWISPEGGSSLKIEDLTFPERPAFPAIELPAGFTRQETTVGPPPGTTMEPWTLERPDGTAVSLDELRGQVVVLDFWATWCPPCRAELLALDRLLEDFEDHPVIAFAVNSLESLEPGDPEAFMTELGISLDVLLAGDEVHGRLAPGNLPALAVIDAKGRLVGVTTGYLGEGSDRYIQELITRALAGTSSPPSAVI